MKEEKIIAYDSPEAAKEVTLTGWVGGGRFWGKDEHAARCAGCTHRKCEDCDNLTEKHWIRCEECRRKKSVEYYNALPFKEWNGDPVCTWDGDTYFFSEDDLIDYCDTNEIESLDLLFCVENPFREVGYDYWSDDMPDNMDELPNEIEKALDALNEVIKKQGPISYSPGKIRTTYKYQGENSDECDARKAESGNLS